MHRSGFSNARRAGLVVAAFALAGLAGCGGDDDSPIASEAGGASETTVGTPGGDGDAGNDAGNDDPAATAARAELVLDGRTHLFTEGNCSIRPDIDLVEGSFTNDDGNEMTLTSSNGVVLIRMTIDGVALGDTGGAEEPTASGSTATWSGDIAIVDLGDNPFDATITLHC